MEDILLVGFGGHAKSLADCIEKAGEYRIAGYTDLCIKESRYKYLGRDEDISRIYDTGIRYAAVGIGYLGKERIREVVYDKLKAAGFILPVIKDPSAVISDTAVIGEGTFIGKGAVVNTEARIGRMSIINTKALIEHECEVGEFTHVAVGAVLCGQVKTGRGAFIGANATVVQCLQIPEYSIVPAGEVIRR